MIRARGPEVVVVGAGPAGSVSALLLARRGHRVSLLDRAHFPRPKPCGEAINPGGVATLARLGLLDSVLEAEPARLPGWIVRGEEGPEAAGSFREGGALGISRLALDEILLSEANGAGVEVHEGVRVTGIETRGWAEPVRVRTGSGSISAPLVVGADGLRSVVAREIDAYRRGPRLRKVSLTFHVRFVGGAPPGIPGDRVAPPDRGQRSSPDAVPERSGNPAARGVLTLASFGTIGLAPIGRGGLWNCTVVVGSEGLGEALRGDPVGFTRTALHRAGLPGGDDLEIVDGPWASGPFDWPTRTSYAPRVILAGDAAGYYDPLTGQGIFRALRSAEAAAGAVDHALGNPNGASAAFESYDRTLRRAFSGKRRVQRMIEAAVSSDGSRRWFLARLARDPRSLDALLGVTGDLDRASSLLRPQAWLSLIRPGPFSSSARPT